MQQCGIRIGLGWWSKVAWRRSCPCQEAFFLSLLDKSVAGQGCADILRDVSLQWENSGAFLRFSPGRALLQKKSLLGEWVSDDLWESQIHNTEQRLKCYLLIHLIEMLFMLVLSFPNPPVSERWHNERMTFFCGVMDWPCVGHFTSHSVFSNAVI